QARPLVSDRTGQVREWTGAKSGNSAPECSVPTAIRIMHRNRIAALIIFLGLIPAYLAAQDVEGVRLGLMYQPEFQPGLVVLPFVATGGADNVSRPLQAIIRQDLDYSDRFEMMTGAAG